MAYDHEFLKGVTSKMIEVHLRQASDGNGKTGLVYNSAGLTCYYIREGAASATAVALVDATLGSFTSKGFKEVDGTNAQGAYQFGIPNVALTGSVDAVTFYFQHSGIIAARIRIRLKAIDDQNATSMGLGNLNAAITTRSSHTSSDAKADLTTLEERLSIVRAGYLDNLNVSGLVASQAEVVAIQNNTRVVRVVPPVMERPDTGSTIFVIRLYLYDTEGNMEAPDSAPTVTVENQDGTDRSNNLISDTLDQLGTGIYEGYYTLASGHAIEALYFEFTIIEGGATRKYANPAMVVDTTAVDFTTADRVKLGAIEAMLPSATYLKGSADADGGMDTADKADVNAEVDQSITDSGIVADIAAVPTAAENAAELQTTIIDGSLTFNDVIKSVASMTRGVIARNGDVYQLKNQAGVTLFTWTISPTGRAIS